MAVAGSARWTWICPALAWIILLITPLLGGGGFVYSAAGVALFGTVFAAVYHAEMVAHRVGEPFGTLILALAVTVIETALIVSVMIAAPAEKAGLARDTVFAAVMIVCNGIVGACLLWGGVRHHEQGFQAQGASAALAVLVALTSLTMVLPNLAAQELGPVYNKPQLIFAGMVSLVLYFAFVFIQTVRHRDYFLAVQGSKPEEHLPPPDNTTTAVSAILIRALSIAPQHARAHLGLGNVKIFTNRTAQGISECERALALDRNLAEAHTSIGIAKVLIGRSAETEAHVQDALRLSPRDNSVYRWLYIIGGAKLQLGADAEAVGWIQRSLEVNRNYPVAHFHLAAALALLGKLKEARAAVRDGLALDPYFTRRRFLTNPMSDNPTFLDAEKRISEGMRMAGVPEG